MYFLNDYFFQRKSYLVLLKRFFIAEILPRGFLEDFSNLAEILHRAS